MKQSRSLPCRRAGIRPAASPFSRSLTPALVSILVAIPVFGQLPAANPVAPVGAVGSSSASRTDPLPRRFMEDLGENLRALWSRDNLAPVVIGGLAAASVSPADARIAGYFENRPGEFTQFAAPGNWGGRRALIAPALGATIAIGALSGNSRLQHLSYDLTQGMILNAGLTMALKGVSDRTRPDGSNEHSFPSGHASTSFMWATVVSRHYGWKAAIPAYAFAGYVGASRVAANKHYLSDVIVGATVGYIVGRTVSRETAEDRRVSWNVAVPPGGGAALTVNIKAW